MEEQELIRGVIAQNEESFIKLVNLYKKKIIGLCYSYTEDFNEAEDLSQDIFINIYKHIKNFKGDSSLSTYIYRISVNKCIDYKRKRNFKSFLTGFIESETYEWNVDDKTVIRQSIKELPKDLKTPIVLYYYVGLSQKEIAEVLKISEKAVEGRIYRAKNKLKTKLTEGGFELWSKSGAV